MCMNAYACIGSARTKLTDLHKHCPGIGRWQETWGSGDTMRLGRADLAPEGDILDLALVSQDNGDACVAVVVELEGQVAVRLPSTFAAGTAQSQPPSTRPRDGNPPPAATATTAAPGAPPMTAR